MDDNTIIRISQYQETPITTVDQASFVYRYAYSCSAESRAADAIGQDYLEIRVNQHRLVFVLCDGVGQSFLGDFAARYLGNSLSNWLWHNGSANSVDVLQMELEKYLQTLTVDATEQVMNYQLPQGLPDLIKLALEEQRRYGSECMFVAGIVDVKINQLVLARMGDPRIRLWESSRIENTAFDSAFSGRARWSTRSGPIQKCDVLLSPLQGFARLAAYSDGLAILDKWRGSMPRKQELNSMISEAKNASFSDDISFFEILLPTSLENNFEEPYNPDMNRFPADAVNPQTIVHQEVIAGFKDPSANFSRPLRVFLCHASQDKTSVRKLYKQLKSANIDPWLDEEKLLGGQDWHSEITKAIRSSDVILVCLSKNSISKEGFVQSEIKLALDVASEKPQGIIFLIPLRLEECDVPQSFRPLQWVNYFEDKGFEQLNYAFRARAVNLGLTSDDK